MLVLARNNVAFLYLFTVPVFIDCLPLLRALEVCRRFFRPPHMCPYLQRVPHIHCTPVTLSLTSTSFLSRLTRFSVLTLPTVRPKASPASPFKYDHDGGIVSVQSRTSGSWFHGQLVLPTCLRKFIRS